MAAPEKGIIEDAVRDVQTVEPEGTSVAQRIEGVCIRDLPPQVDDRGWLCELYDPRWGFHEAPLVYAYAVSVRPGVIKGWAMHKHHEDRYAMILGRMRVVLYDDRPTSSTRGQLSVIDLSDQHRQLLSIPIGVWHADQNIGEIEALFMNFPTQPYDHASPDKYRLPLNTDQIPYRFDNPCGY